MLCDWMPDAYVAIAEKLSRKIFSSMSQLLVHYRPFCIYDAKVQKKSDSHKDFSIFFQKKFEVILHLDAKVRFFFELCKDFSIFFQKKFEVSHFPTLDINILEELEAEKLYYILLIYNI